MPDPQCRTQYRVIRPEPDSFLRRSLLAQSKLRRSRDTWRAWALILAMVLMILVMALIAQGWPL